MTRSKGNKIFHHCAFSFAHRTRAYIRKNLLKSSQKFTHNPQLLFLTRKIGCKHELLPIIAAKCLIKNLVEFAYLNRIAPPFGDRLPGTSTMKHSLTQID